jgi:hypothetical protein
MDVEFGWNDWVAITTPRSLGASYAAKRLVPAEEDLADLLSSFGLPEREADSLARELWQQKPETREPTAELEPDPDAGPAPGRRLLVVAALLTLLLLAVAAALAATFA